MKGLFIQCEKGVVFNRKVNSDRFDGKHLSLFVHLHRFQSLFCCYYKIPNENNLRRKALVWLAVHSVVHLSKGITAATTGGSWACCICRQEAKSQECLQRLCSLSPCAHSPGSQTGKGITHRWQVFLPQLTEAALAARGDSVVKSSCHSCKAPKFNCQHPCWVTSNCL